MKCFERRDRRPIFELEEKIKKMALGYAEKE